MGSRIIGQLSGSLDDRAHRLEIIANSYPKEMEKVEKRMAASKFPSEESQLSKMLSEQGGDGGSSNEHRSPASRLSGAAASSSSSFGTAATSSASVPGRQATVSRAYINKMAEHATDTISKSQCDAFVRDLGQCEASDLVNDHTLALLALLADTAKLARFREFLLREYALENLVFFLACEKYKRVKSAERPVAAQLIYTLHIAQRSKLQVNLPHSIRETIDVVAQQQFADATETLFQYPQVSIFRLLQTDSFRRFNKQ
jgi:Regulator of G protein signaling domain